MVRTKKPAKLSALAKAAPAMAHYFEHGCVVAVDPSIGSQSSQPAISVMINGYLVNVERLNINPNKPYYFRLRDLHSQLQEIVQNPDLLIIENIPPFMMSAGSSFRTGGVVHLHQSVGAILSCWDVKDVLEVSPSSWHAWVKRNVGEDKYKKSDEHDSICLLMTAMEAAKAGKPEIIDTIIEELKV